MDDFSGMLNQLLGNEQLMRQVQQLADGLGLNQPGPPARNPPPPAAPEQELSLLASKIAGNQLEPTAELLKALGPLLSGTRRKRADEAVRLIQLLELLPTLQKAGLFGDGPNLSAGPPTRTP